VDGECTVEVNELTTQPQSIQISKPLGDEAMRTVKLLFATIIACGIAGLYGATLNAQDSTPGSSTGMKDMNPQMEQMHAQMEQMRTQMVQLQALMKDSMDKMAAADAAMKAHMETEQASMKSQMALQQAVIDHLQTMNDHMQAMRDHMEVKHDAMDMPKKTGAKMKKDKGMTSDQK
jgi:hypothetical protein